MTTQLTMDLRPAEAPKVSEEEVRELEVFLGGSGGWVKAREFPSPWNERRLRAIANASAGRIISGQQGYKLTRLATIEEVQHAAAWLRSQGTAMIQRAVEIDRVYHKKMPVEGAGGGVL